MMRQLQMREDVSSFIFLRRVQVGIILVRANISEVNQLYFHLITAKKCHKKLQWVKYLGNICALWCVWWRFQKLCREPCLTEPLLVCSAFCGERVAEPGESSRMQRVVLMEAACVVLSGRCSAGLCRQCWRSTVFNKCFMLNLVPVSLTVLRLYVLILLMFHRRWKRKSRSSCEKENQGE